VYAYSENQKATVDANSMPREIFVLSMPASPP